MEKRVVVPNDVRRGQILSAAISLIKEDGWDILTRGTVAERAECATGTVSRLFGEIDDFKSEVMKHLVSLIENGDHCDELIMALALGLGKFDEDAMNAPREVKDLALLMMGGE